MFQAFDVLYIWHLAFVTHIVWHSVLGASWLPSEIGLAGMRESHVECIIRTAHKLTRWLIIIPNAYYTKPACLVLVCTFLQHCCYNVQFCTTTATGKWHQLNGPGKNRVTRKNCHVDLVQYRFRTYYAATRCFWTKSFSENQTLIQSEIRYHYITLYSLH